MAGFTDQPPAADPVRLVALKELLDRGFGKAVPPDKEDGEIRRVIVEYRWGDDTEIVSSPSVPAIATPSMVIQGTTTEDDVVWQGECPSSVRQHDKVE
jgi:hypothetical protein